VIESRLQVCNPFFFFVIFGVFSPDFVFLSFEKFFFDSFHAVGC
jgi:hypothetical protein